MSGLFPTVVVASDLRSLKDRINPQVSLVDAIVQRTASLDAATRGEWQAFAAQWREFFGSDGFLTSSQMDAGQALERKLRDLKSVLSSQCPGVPSPAPKRDVPFLPTWVTPNLVREQKTRIGPRVRDVGRKAAQAPGLEEGVRRAWAEFHHAWSAFESEAEEWTHGAAQWMNALAFEDVLPEWEDAIAMASAGFAAPAPAPAETWFPPARGVAPGLPVPAASAGTSTSAGSGAAVLAIGAAVLVVGVVLLKGSHPS